MAGRPSLKVKSHEAVQELNTLPIMNVFMILIPFLLLSASFVELTIVDTTLPSRGSSKDKGSQDNADKPKLNLTVFITNEGFVLAGFGGVLQVGGEEGGEEGKEEEAAAASSKRFRIEKVAARDKAGRDVMEYDWDKLLENLLKVKKAFPDHYTIIILPDNEVAYKTIIRLMDLSREYVEKKPDGSTARHLLFPSPIMAWSVT